MPWTRPTNGQEGSIQLWSFSPAGFTGTLQKTLIAKDESRVKDTNSCNAIFALDDKLSDIKSTSRFGHNPLLKRFYSLPLSTMTQYFISITGLTLKSNLYYPKFMAYAIPCVIEAKKSDGNVSTKTKTRNGVHHTLTVWENKMAMRKFMVAGAHRKAMAITAAVADLDKTKVYGYESDTIPDWDEAIQIWETHGKLHGNYSSKLVSSSSTMTLARRNTASFSFVAAILLAFVLYRSDVIRYCLMSIFSRVRKSTCMPLRLSNKGSFSQSMEVSSMATIHLF
eukprot:scaffold2619_cov129-Cylindrotheca_fusiformis.AAC.20